MVNKYYCFAGLTFAVHSDIDIENSRFFNSFYVNGTDNADFVITVKEGNVSQRAGREIYTQNTSALYEADGERIFYSSFTDAKTGVRTDFACMRRKGSELLLTVDRPLRDNVLFKAVNIPSLMLEKGSALLHSSFVIYNGEAILFTGKSGVGKTTQALLWQDHRGAQLVNGDRAALRFENGDLYAFAVPFCGSSDIALNRKAKIRAVAALGQSERNEITVSDASSAFRSILSGISYEPRNIHESRIAVDFAARAASTRLVYTMKCRKDETSVCSLETLLKV